LSIESDKDLVDKLLKGRTMSVYALLLSQGEMGVRDIQRALKLSSPSLALHHLTKLIELDLVRKDEHGIYSISKTVRVGSLSLFIKFGSTLLPRFLFLGTLSIAMLILYVIFFLVWPPKGNDLMFIALSLIVIIIVLYESRQIWILKPF
jgi:hypothetical protein